MLQVLVQNKKWFFPSSACVNTAPAGCSPFGLCCSVPSSLLPPFSVSHPVIYFTGHNFINRNFLSLALTPFFFFAWYHFSFLNKYNCPSYCIRDLITLGLFQEEWRPCYFIYSFTCSFIQPAFDEHLLGVRYWVQRWVPPVQALTGSQRRRQGNQSLPGVLVLWQRWIDEWSRGTALRRWKLWRRIEL